MQLLLLLVLWLLLDLLWVLLVATCDVMVPYSAWAGLGACWQPKTWLHVLLLLWLL
jgi:hypothetical protein